MATPPRKRRLSQNACRALETVAADQPGITESLMLARGFSQRMLTGLIHAGSRCAPHALKGRRTIKVSYMMITAARRSKGSEAIEG